jgi:hypothetical protein
MVVFPSTTESISCLIAFDAFFLASEIIGFSSTISGLVSIPGLLPSSNEPSKGLSPPLSPPPSTSPPLSSSPSSVSAKPSESSESSEAVSSVEIKFLRISFFHFLRSSALSANETGASALLLSILCVSIPRADRNFSFPTITEPCLERLIQV